MEGLHRLLHTMPSCIHAACVREGMCCVRAWVHVLLPNGRANRLRRRPLAIAIVDFDFRTAARIATFVQRPSSSRAGSGGYRACASAIRPRRRRLAIAIVVFEIRLLHESRRSCSVRRPRERGGNRDAGAAIVALASDRAKTRGTRRVRWVRAIAIASAARARLHMRVCVCCMSAREGMLHACMSA